MPDSVFVEDMAIVFDEMAILTRPGADSRRRETPAIAAALAAYRPLPRDSAAGHHRRRRRARRRAPRVRRAVDAHQRRGGDADPAASLGPFGYTVVETEVRGCLHLKSAVTALDDDRLLVNPAWIDAAAFDGFSLVDVAAEEPSAANVLRLADRIIAAQAFPRTAERIAGARPARRAGRGERAREGGRRGHVL